MNLCNKSLQPVSKSKEQKRKGNNIEEKTIYKENQ
jgi:hypothetical protein